MSLFPAYGQGGGGGVGLPGAEAGCVEPMVISSGDEDGDTGECLSPESERALLEPRSPPPAAPPRAPAPADSADFYVDCKLDRGNLRVSTLYYPARPEYRAAEWRGVGTGRRGRGRRDSKREKVKRYWRRAPPPPDPARAAEEVLQRRNSYKRALDQDPTNEHLWMQYIDFLECCSETEGGGAAAAAQAGAEALKAVVGVGARGRGGAGLPARYHAALRRALQPAQLADKLSDMRAQERGGCARGELWAREVSARACAGGCAGVRGAATGAARDRLARPYYHNPLLVYAMSLRSGDLWEEATQLVELSASMLLGRALHLAPADAHKATDADQQLEHWEHKTINSGLPLNETWSRVERARSRLHWRPAPEADALALAADPQRAPAPPAELLVPAAGGNADFRMLVSLLRAAETPLLPAAHHVHAACAGSEGAALVLSDWECSLGVSLLSLLRCARRLPPAHPARALLTPGAARTLLAHTPLRAASALTQVDNTEWWAWRSALWECMVESVSGRARAALLCWRLRELHTYALLAQGNEACVRLARTCAREALKRWSGGGALPFAVFARLEGAAGGAGRGLRAAIAAARQARTEPIHEQLYIARVVCEVGVGVDADAGAHAGRWAVCCAAVGRPLPPDDKLTQPVPRELLTEARQQCELRCSQLEEQYSHGGDEGGEGDGDGEGEGEWGGASAVEALLPGRAEWGAARVVLAEPQERAALLNKLLKASAWRGAGAARWREQCACALVAAGGAGGGEGAGAGAALAATLQHLAPLNAYLALMSSTRVPAAAMSRSGGEGRLSPLAPPPCELRVWAGLLPAALAAANTNFAPTERRVLLGACERAIRGGGAGCAGGALLHALRLETHPAPRDAALSALAHAPHSKWLQWRCAALGAVPPHTLCELALERGLRLRALPEELTPLTLPSKQH